MSMQNVYFRRRTAPNSQCNTSQQTQQVITNPIAQQPLKSDLISKEGANALRAYTIQSKLNFEGTKPKNFGTSKEYIDKLISKGLVEGKDFTVEKDGKFIEVHLKKNGKTTKDMVWFNEDKGETFECYRLQYHSQNNPLEGVITCYGGDGKFRYRNTTYETSPIKNDDINIHISPKDYENYLKQNNIEYKSIYEPANDNKYNQIYSVYNPKTDRRTRITFERDLSDDHNISIHKQIYNADNEHTKTVHYYNDCTEITEFKENLKYKT